MTIKNLFLLTAVIGCGLFTTILKTSKNGQQARVEQEQQVIFVLAKDLFVGTKLEREKLAAFIKKKWVSKTEVPPNAILNEDELVGATVTRNLKADDCFLTPYVSRLEGLMPPSGKHIFTLKLPYEHVGPWVQQGKEVDVVCKHRTPGSQVVRHFRLLNKIPVLAVDYDKPETNSTDKPIIYTVTLEVGINETSLLQMAQDAGASLRLLVRNGHEANIRRLSDDELYEILNGTAKEKQNREDPKK